MSLVCEFYANWNTRRVEINSGYVRNSGVHFSIEALNDFLDAPNCDRAEFVAMIEQPLYRDIRHTLCGLTYIAMWDRVGHGSSLDTSLWTP